MFLSRSADAVITEYNTLEDLRDALELDATLEGFTPLADFDNLNTTILTQSTQITNLQLLTQTHAFVVTEAAKIEKNLRDELKAEKEKNKDKGKK
jgi:hypothetical protein